MKDDYDRAGAAVHRAARGSGLSIQIPDNSDSFDDSAELSRQMGDAHTMRSSETIGIVSLAAVSAFRFDKFVRLCSERRSVAAVFWMTSLTRAQSMNRGAGSVINSPFIGEAVARLSS